MLTMVDFVLVRRVGVFAERAEMSRETSRYPTVTSIDTYFMRARRDGKAVNYGDLYCSRRTRHIHLHGGEIVRLLERNTRRDWRD